MATNYLKSTFVASLDCPVLSIVRVLFFELAQIIKRLIGFSSCEMVKTFIWLFDYLPNNNKNSFQSLLSVKN
jgi:hypothetical protein